MSEACPKRWHSSPHKPPFQRLQGTCRACGLCDGSALRWTTTTQQQADLLGLSQLQKETQMLLCQWSPCSRETLSANPNYLGCMLCQCDPFSSRSQGTSHHTQGQAVCCPQMTSLGDLHVRQYCTACADQQASSEGFQQRLNNVKGRPLC